MSKEKLSSNALTPETAQPSSNLETNSQPSSNIQRRSFLKGLGVAGAALSAAPLLRVGAAAEQGGGSISKGDAAILRFVAAAEIIESDIWLQYNELAGVQDGEVSKLAAKLIPGYPSQITGGNADYTNDIKQLDSDMDQYISDNTEDELSHEVFLNAYLASKGAATISLDAFRTLSASQATGSNKTFGRITNLTQLTVHSDWWTRYRSRSGNPDFGDTFRNAIPTLAVGQHTAIPRTDADVSDANFLLAVAFTAGFHFPWIEQGGSSLYPMLAQRASNAEVLRVLLSIGGTEICHFQTWQDKAGNIVPTTAVDPVTGVSVTFPDLNSPPFGGENFQTNLIMPEPTVFLSRQFPPVSIIRPTETKGAAMGAVNALTKDGLFIGQSNQFMQLLQDLASDADKAQRNGDH
jgi:hypothetical protein